MVIGLLLDDNLDKPDGVQQYVKTLGGYLQRQGHDVHYLVGASSNSSPNIHVLGRVLNLRFNRNTVGTPLPSPLKTRQQVRKLFKEIKFDVIHVQSPHSPLLAGVVIKAASRRQVAITSTFHILPAGFWPKAGSSMLRFILWRSLRQIDCFISNTTATQDFLKSTWKRSSRLIPNPVRVSDFSKSKPKSPGPKKQIVFLGRLVDRKGVTQLLEAFALLPPDLLESSHLTIGGKGPEMGALKKRLEELKLKNVTLAGFIDEADKPNFLAQADLAVFPSLYGESFGISLLEPMAARAGVVLAGDNPGYRCVLGMQPKLMFDPSDVLGFRDHLEFWLNIDEQNFKDMHNWQQQHVKNYDIDKVVGPEVVKLYQETITSLPNRTNV